MRQILLAFQAFGVTAAVAGVAGLIAWSTANPNGQPVRPSNTSAHKQARFASLDTSVGKCWDGTLSYAASNQRACIYHGGVVGS